MKRIYLLSCLAAGVLALGTGSVHAQSYEQRWNEVKEMQKKDLPKSVIDLTTGIFEKAKAEHNLPQMLKAYLERTQCRVQLTPDSLRAEMLGLEQWAGQETDSVRRAVLDNVLGCYRIDLHPEDVEKAISYFRASLKAEDALARVPADTYRPLKVDGELSKRYLGDNLLDLLVHQAIGKLQEVFVQGEKKRILCQREALAYYDRLAHFYARKQNPTAELQVKLTKLQYQVGRNVLPMLALSPQEALAQLEKWTKAYAGHPICAAVYAQMADIYKDRGDYVKELAAVREGMRLYPESEFADDLKQYEKEVLEPDLQVSGEWAYPGKESHVEIRSCNLKGMTLELYRLRLNASDGALFSGGEPAKLIKKCGSRVASTHYSLPDTPLYKDTLTTVKYPMPEEGIYVLKAIPDGYAGKADYRLLYVSPYQVVFITGDRGAIEGYVVDKLSGKPVPHAELVYYEAVNGHFKQKSLYRTDGRGRALLPSNANRNVWMNARKSASKDFMEIAYANSAYTWGGSHTTADKVSVKLFTDRTIYRPGQQVFVSGVAYGQQGDSVKVRKDYTVELTLRDANYKEIVRKRLTTDGFGGFSAELSLPENVLPGMFRIVTDQASVGIRVEEYKRPTYEVRFTPFKGTYNMGDSVRLEGVAKAFSGAPVRQAAVRYTVTREEASFWRFTSNRELLAEGETRTDADGKFALTALLEKVDKEPEGWGNYYIYKVKAEVTGNAGETQEGTISLPVGKQSIGLTLQGLQGQVAREKKPQLQVRAINLNREPVKAEVTLKAYAADKEGRQTGDPLWQMQVEAQKAFTPAGLYALPAGRYCMEASTTDAQGRVCTSKEVFVLFSLADRKMPVKETSWFYQDGSEFAAPGGEDPALYVGTSEKNVCLFYDVYTCSAGSSPGSDAIVRRIHSERITLSDEVRKFSFPYKPEYGEGITVSFAFVREGDLYDVQRKIVRRQPDKQLTLKWETFRDKLRPGETETWTLHVTGKEGRPADARLIATLYDASLDKFSPADWQFSLAFPRIVPLIRPALQQSDSKWYLVPSFTSRVLGWLGKSYFLMRDRYSRFELPFILPYLNNLNTRVLAGTMVGVTMDKMAAPRLEGLKESAVQEWASPALGFKKSMNAGVVTDAKQSAVETQVEESASLRGNFAETAFFYPDLHADSAGNVRITFTVPESLTEWKFLGFAHTRDMDFGLQTGKAVTSKPFMVQPNLPRFLRTGDHTSIATSLINLSEGEVSGKVKMQLIDPATEQVVHNAVQSFSVGQGQTGTATFTCDVKEGYDLLVCRITAEAGDFSDGEQHYLPVLTDKQWMTETVPVQVNEEGTVTVKTNNLFNKQSRTAIRHRLTVELTANPDWYAVQALPVVGNPAGEDALSWAASFYANTLASAIVQANPRIKQVFERWKAQGGSKETLLSNLEKNQDLKQLLLNETPWVMEAENETEQKHRIALLFDLNTMETRREAALSKLEALQGRDGSWSWFKGMPGSEYVTREVAEMLVRLHAMQINLDGRVMEMYGKALDYLKKKVEEECERMQEAERKGEKNVRPSENTVHYLYLCALDSRRPASREMTDYLLKHLEGRSGEYTIYGKALASIVMQVNGKANEAADLIKSLRQYVVSIPEMGSYFDTPKAYYSWRSYRIPTQVAAMEALQRVAPDVQLLNAMKQWLLKQKQVQAWSDPVATVDAVYAFLCMNGNKLDVNGSMKAEVGRQVLQTPQDALGYTRRTFADEEAKVPSIRISKSGEGMGWGAVYAQFFEDASRIRSARGNGVDVERELWKKGEKVNQNTPLAIGDKVTVRLTVKADRDMDFIQLKDERAACMEPAEQLSGYRWNESTGYYCVTRDASTEFFFDKLRKGTCVIEYDVYIDRSGTYHAGSAIVQSAYAPEYSGHSGGLTLTVK